MNSDEFDACECLWNHEQAMQRLLAFIRQNQNECSDSYCNDAMASLQVNVHQNNCDVSSNGNFIFIILMLLLISYLISNFPFVAATLKRFGRRTHRNEDLSGGNSSSSNFQPPPSPPAPPAIN